jgi:MFS transporter, ACS family, D-galactonate transporter
VLPLVETGLHVTLFQLGIVLAAFLVGAATFQIPAGLAALRWGSRPVSLAALGVMGAFALASAFAPNWYVLAALRFGTGAGAGLFFAPGLGLVATYFPAGTRGPIIGLYNAGFSAGAAVGVLLGAVIGLAFGWSWALALGGVGLLGMAAAATVFLPAVPPPEAKRGVRGLLRAARPILRSRAIWALGFAITGLWASFYIVAQYFVQYAAHVHPAWSLTLAAALPTVMIAVEIVGGPIGGWAAERARDMRVALVVMGVSSTVVILFIPFLPLVGLVPLFLLLGFADGVVFAVLYLIPSYHPDAQGEALTLALALINCVEIFAGSAAAIAFAYIAGEWGYTAAWIFAGAIGVLTLPLLAWVPGGRGGPLSAPVAPSGADGARSAAGPLL